MTARQIPMLFTRAMVLALLAGRKTQTRRMKFNGKAGDLIWVREAWRTYASLDAEAPRRIWTPDMESGAALFYEAGGSQFISKAPGGDLLVPRAWSQDDEIEHPGAGKLRPSMFLPKWGSRLTLRITEVRQERLRDISEEDAEAEGVELTGRHDEQRWRNYDPAHWLGEGFLFAVNSYASLWDSINRASGRGFDTDPMVHVVTFEVVRESIASITQIIPLELE